MDFFLFSFFGFPSAVLVLLSYLVEKMFPVPALTQRKNLRKEIKSKTIRRLDYSSTWLYSMASVSLFLKIIFIFFSNLFFNDGSRMTSTTVRLSISTWTVAPYQPFRMSWSISNDIALDVIDFSLLWKCFCANWLRDGKRLSFFFSWLNIDRG